MDNKDNLKAKLQKIFELYGDVDLMVETKEGKHKCQVNVKSLDVYEVPEFKFAPFALIKTSALIAHVGKVIKGNK